MSYNVVESAKRMDEILNSVESRYVDSRIVPSKDSLTYNNGYYVNVIALFIDIVGSSDLTDEHNRPTLAKIYRCFISECTAIMNSSELCKNININGDCVWGIFEKKKVSDIDEVFDVSGRLNSMINILNYKLERKGYSQISVGIGIDYGRALMVQAGYKGSGIKDVVWMGDVVNKACHISNKAGRDGNKPLMISENIYHHLSPGYALLMDYTDVDGEKLYEGNIGNTIMNKWYSDYCK